MVPMASKWLEQILHTQNGYSKYTDLKIWRLFNPNPPFLGRGKNRGKQRPCDEYELLQHLKDIFIFLSALYTLQRFFLKENSEWGQVKKKYHCCWEECWQFRPAFFLWKMSRGLSQNMRHWPVKSAAFVAMRVRRHFFETNVSQATFL